MPLVRFEVRNEVGLGDPGLYGGGGGGGAGAAAGAAAGKRGVGVGVGEEDPKALLEGVAVAGLVGILRQLGDLAEFAADVFHDLHEQVIATSARGRKVLTRVQNIEAALPSLEKAVKNQKSHIHFAYVPGSEWHTRLQNEQNHLLSTDLPRFMMDSYEECRDPPRLYLLDKFDTAGAGACLKRYSDPSYFKKAWDMTRADRTVNLHREKRSQKFKKRGSRLREPYATSRRRSGEFQRSLTTAQIANRQFASPSIDGQSFSEHRSTPDARSNTDNISRSSSFSSRIRSSSVEQALDSKPSAAPHENGHGKSSNTKLHRLSDPSATILLNDRSVDNPGDDLKQGSLPDDMVDAGSPSVKWDEKAAIVMSKSSVYCDDVVMDKVEGAEPTDISHGQKDHREMDNLEQQAVLIKKTNSPLIPSVLNNHDEIPSEADNYMDALNTLESETETEPEFQTKSQAMSVPSFNAETSQAVETDNIVSHHPDPSVPEFTDRCQDSNMPGLFERTAELCCLPDAGPPEISQPDLSDYPSLRAYKEDSVISDIHERDAERAHGDPYEISELALQVHTAITPNEISPDYNQIPEIKAEDDPEDSTKISESELPASIKESVVVNKTPESDAESVGGFINEATESILSVPTISSVPTDEAFKIAPDVRSSPCDTSDDSCVISESRPHDYPDKIPTISSMPTDEALKMASAVQSSPCDNSDDSCVISESRPEDYPGNNLKEVGDCGATEVSNSWTGALDDPLVNRCKPQDAPTNTSPTFGVSSLWTNAGLFGLEPSKPPVFGAQEGPRVDTLPAFKESQQHHAPVTEFNCSKPIESAAIDVPDGSTSITSSFVGKLVGIRPGSTNPNSSGINQSAPITPDSVHSQTDGPSFDQSSMIGKHTSISELLESEESGEHGSEKYSSDMAGRNNMPMVSASSFSSIAQRFLANTLQRRTSPKYTDLPVSSGRANTDAGANDEAPLNPISEPSKTVFEDSQFEKVTDNGMNGDVFSSSYSEKSSPPLEYMKISFHPMSASDMSKLNMDFCDGNLHENSDDMMLPTFQLLSESSIPQPGSGSESEDDTFGRSYSYSSYDDLSPRLYSNSEAWDQEDGVALEDHEFCDNSHQIGSTPPISSYMGFKQMNLSGTKSTIELADIGDHNGIGTLGSHTVEELPNFDTLMSRNNNQNGETSTSNDAVNLLQDEDQLPPPPPLPPMQWRMMRQTPSLEERGTATKNTLSEVSSLPHVHDSAQEEHLPAIALPDPHGHTKEADVQKTDGTNEISNPPSIIEIKSSLLQQIRDKSEQLKLNGHGKPKAIGSDIKGLDEREELLQQIRSKTFNLRRTNNSKTDASSQSTTNSNVVAILEKANAIRQAVASDEGGDDDNWSDI